MSNRPIPGDTSSDTVLVLGAGVSGLVAASVLLDQGHSVTLVDNYAKPGGNHIDIAVGPYTFDIGSLIFQDDSPLVDRFPELLPNYVPISPTWAKVTPRGHVTSYPFSLRGDLVALGPSGVIRSLASVLTCRVRHRKMATARDFANYWVGNYFLKASGLESYMERFYGSASSAIDIQFARARMQWLPENASTKGAIRLVYKNAKRRDPGNKPNQQLARPRSGYEALYKPVVERIRSEGASISLGASLDSIGSSGQNFFLQSGDHQFEARRVVSTLPLDRICRLVGLELPQPPTATLVSLFFSFGGDRRFAQSVLYNFTHEGDWKRLTMYSDFYGKVDGRDFFTVEILTRRDPSGFLHELVEGFRSHTRRLELFLGDLVLEGHHVLDSAYPLYLEGAAEQAAIAIKHLRAIGIESFGRQGGFQYQPTARMSTQVAEASLKNFGVLRPE